MAKNSNIEWTKHTFNPWWGCVEVSPACDHCYAKTFAQRVGYSGTGSQFPIWGVDTERRFFGDKHWDEPLKWNAAAEAAGVMENVFCGSMCDVMEKFSELHDPRARLCRMIPRTLNLNWLLLTKRPQNFRRFMPDEWLVAPQPNVWGMTTVETEQYRWRAEALAETPFAVRGLSMEPLLEHVDISDILARGSIHWVIAGGESGPGARPMRIQWAESLRDQCKAAGVSFFMKQLGVSPIWAGAASSPIAPSRGKNSNADEWPSELRIREFPEVKHA